MKKEPFAWVDAEEHEDESGTEKSNELKDEREYEWSEVNIFRRLEDLEEGRRMDKSSELNMLKRLEELEKEVSSLKQEKPIEPEEACVDRETVLDAWSKAPSTTMERGPNDINYEGDIRADILAIHFKEKSDPETADRWKAVFLDRYAIEWGVDCGEQSTLLNYPLEMIRVFNIRARVLYGWGKTRTQILDICDDWISRWRSENVAISTKEFCQLCRYYYA
ncbi:hypothetical protein PITC_012690 [Penicillium italicum]|uniref:Uncharacterized protein n=1 Tax=Penicillium italicum TaxID=40296 RepID=A0A0A2K854_PENIT|nr:hypothetical protein PITC_012690 [Penicillium italicum]